MTGPFLAHPGGIPVRFEGLERAAAPMREWIDLVLGPLAGPDFEAGGGGGSQIVVRFEDGVTPKGRRLPPVPGGPLGDRFFVADHLGRGAVFPLPPQESDPIVVDALIDPSFFQTWVYFPHLRSVLRRRSGVLVHAAAAEISGSRVALTGWGGAGKTGVLLELLRRGGDLLADDWLALFADGTAAPVTGHLEIMRFQWERTLRRSWPGRPTWIRSSVVRAADAGSRLTRRRTSVSRGLARLAQVWHPDTLWIPVGDAFPGRRVTTAGPLDALVVLVPPDMPEPPEPAVPELVALQTQTFLSDHAALEAAWRYGAPGRQAEPLFPTAQEELEITTKGLSGARIEAVSFDPGGGDVAGAADAVLAAAGSGDGG